MFKIIQSQLTRCKISGSLQRMTCVRYFSLQDAASALRPFFFLVHPDFFGQYPNERTVNENSLKVLNEYLSAYHTHTNKRRRPPTREIMFYMRKGNSLSPELRLVKIPLDASTLRETVLIILRTCGLSDIHVAAETKPDYSANRPIVWHQSYYAATGKKNPNAQTRQKTFALSLRSWLSENIEQSRTKSEAVRCIKDDIHRLLNKLKNDLSLVSIRCDSVWGLHNFRGCLISFDRLCNRNPEFVREVLKDRVLVFSNATGVSRTGEIVLSGEDVPEYWYPLLMSIFAYDVVLLRLPMMEEKLSSLLNGITILRKEKRHRPVMAEEYELMLNRVINTLRRCQDYVTDTFQHSDLSSLQLVVDGEASPMMLSSAGQLLIPCSIPGTIVVDFIKKNQEQALSLIQHMEQLLKKEKTQTLEATKVLELQELNKDESVSPSQMVSCCTRLIDQAWTLTGPVSLSGCRIRVSHYHSVMQDGEICIPWDWVGTDYDDGEEVQDEE